MSDPRVKSLADCTELREAILARPPGVVLVSFVLAVLLLTSGVAWLALTEVDLVIEAPGVVKAREWEVHSGVDGKIDVVLFEVGQLVQEGEVLIEIDATKLEESLRMVTQSLAIGRARCEQYRSLRATRQQEQEAERLQVDLEVRMAEAELGGAQSEVQTKEYELARARGAVEDAEERLGRRRELLEDGHVREEDVTDLEGDLRDRRLLESIADKQLARARIDLARATEQPALVRAAGQIRVRNLEARIRDHDITIDVEEERLSVLESNVRDLGHDLEQCTVRAPMTGRITEGEPRIGYRVSCGQRVATIAPDSHWIEAHVANSDIAGVHIGQAVRIKIATYDFREHGTVEGELIYIAPDASTAGYLVKIRLATDFVGDPTRPIALGMNGQAEIVTDRERILALALRGLQKKTKQKP